MLLEFLAAAAAAPIVAGSQAFTSPGTYSFTVPSFTSLTAVVDAAGGGGGGLSSAGSAGGNSSFGSVVANGGAGGGVPGTGADGTASGGTTNTTGGGAAGGVGTIDVANDKGGSTTNSAGDGGRGGRAARTYASGGLTVGATVTVVVGAAGAPGSGTGNTRAPAAGLNGAVLVTWS
jgi:hypothetical protein